MAVDVKWLRKAASIRPSPFLFTQHTSACMKNVFTQPTRSDDRSSQIERQVLQDFLICSKTQSLSHNSTESRLFIVQFRLKSEHMQYVEKLVAAFKWQAGYESFLAGWYSIVRNQESDEPFVSFHTPSPTLQMEAKCNFHLWIYCKANIIHCLPVPQTQRE